MTIANSVQQELDNIEYRNYSKSGEKYLIPIKNLLEKHGVEFPVKSISEIVEENRRKKQLEDIEKVENHFMDIGVIA